MSDPKVHEARPAPEALAQAAPAAESAALALPSRGQATALVGEASRSWAETRAMMEYARTCPRNEDQARDRVLRACARPTFAEAATWELPRGKKKNPETGQFEEQTITGPSVHLARELARSWEHVAHGSRVLEDDGQAIHGESYATDLQRNIHIKKQWRVGKLIQRKVWRNGKPLQDEAGKDVTTWVVPDESQLLEMVQRTAAKMVRGCIFELIPDDLKEDALVAADETLTKLATGTIDQLGRPTQKGAEKDGKVLPALLDRLVGEFRRLTPSVTIEMLERKLGHSIDTASVDEYKTLARIGATIKQGGCSVDEAFPREQAQPAEPQPAEAQEPAASEDPFAQPGTLDQVVAQHAKPAEPTAEPKPHGERARGKQPPKAEQGGALP